MGVSVSVSRSGLLAASAAIVFSLFAAAIGHAQTPPAAPQSPSLPGPPSPQSPQSPPSPPPAQTAPQLKPVTGFVSSYEILRTARAAGFEPLAPPLRDGTIYVLRATDFRGILMRVVLDARTGAIRDATRIVPEETEALGMTAPPYGPPPYASLPYAPPPYEAPSYEQPSYAPPTYGRSLGPPAEYGAQAPELPPGASIPMQLRRPPATLPRTHRAAARSSSPPLPRPRPPDAKTVGVDAAVPPAPSAVPGKTPPPPPLND